MPQVLDNCVSSLLKSWEEDPSKRPQAYNSDQEARSAAYAICTSRLKEVGKLEFGDEEFYLSLDEVRFTNPVMTAWAFTNKPFVQGLDPMSFVDEEGNNWVEGESQGEKLLKVPLIILGTWRHGKGILKFTKDFLKRLEENFLAGKAGHEISADARHKDTMGALAWAVGKFLFEADKKQWSILARPTPQGEEFVENGVYRYGSIEFYPNFEKRLMSATLSTDGVLGAWEPPCIDLEDDPNEEGDMSITAEQLAEMQARLQQLEQEAEAAQQMNQEVERLRGEIEDRNSRIAQLEAYSAEQLVDNICATARAYRDDDSRGHSAVFLEWLRDVLTLGDIGEEENAIRLENRRDLGDVHAYYRRSIAWLAENMPGSGPVTAEAGTEGRERRLSTDSEDDNVDWESEREAIRAEIWGSHEDGGE